MTSDDPKKDEKPAILLEIEDDVAEAASDAVDDMQKVATEEPVLSAKTPDEVMDVGEIEDVVSDDFDVDMDSLEAEMVEDMEDEVHITGDESIDFADEPDVDDLEPKSGKKLGKLLAPLAVLVIAAGAGGYIVMNPDILGGGETAPTPNYVAPAIIPPQGMAANDSNDVANEGLPQPTASQNTVPRPPMEQQPEPIINDPFSSDIANENVVVDAVKEDMAEINDAIQDIVPEPATMEDALSDVNPFDDSIEEELAAMEDVEIDVPAITEPAPNVSDEIAMTDSMADMNISEPVSDVVSAIEADVSQQPVLDISETSEIAPVADSQEVIAILDAPVNEPEIMEVDVPEIQAQPPVISENAPAYAEAVREEAAKPVQQTQDLIQNASDTFYDGGSALLPPVGADAQAAGLRKVDPALEPASQFVVVDKVHKEQDFESLVVSASRALKLKRYESALEIYQGLHKKNPRDQRVLMGLAVAQQNTGMTEAALRTYDDLLKISPNNADAMLNMLGLLKGQYPAVALRRLIDLYQRYPSNASVAAQVGITYADAGNVDEAFRYLGIASSLEPTNAQHLFNIAIIADRDGRVSDAVEYYEKALEADAVYGSGRVIPRETIYDRLAVLRR